MKRTRKPKNERVFKGKIVMVGIANRIGHRIIPIGVVIRPTAIGETSAINEIKRNLINVTEVNAIAQIHVSVRIVATERNNAKAMIVVRVRNNAIVVIAEIVRNKASDKIAEIAGNKVRDGIVRNKVKDKIVEIVRSKLRDKIAEIVRSNLRDKVVVIVQNNENE